MAWSRADWVRGLGAVDFVRHQELAEDRAFHETKSPAMVDALLQHFGAQDIGRHQVRRELNALGVEAEDDAEGLDELGLGEARTPTSSAWPPDMIDTRTSSTTLS